MQQRKKGQSGTKVILAQTCQEMIDNFQEGEAVPDVFHAAFRFSLNWSVVACFHGYGQWTCKDVKDGV